MGNATQVSYLILSAYFDTGAYKYLIFVVIKILYLIMICSNVFLIVVICTNRSLHEPMYLLICSLFANELFGCTCLLPFILVQVLSDIHTISSSLCFLQIFGVHTYGGCEIVNLAIMAYDRYLAICHPLQYHSLMTFRRVMMMIGATWFAAVMSCLAIIVLSYPLQLCGNVIDKVYCANYHIVKLACSDTTINNLYGLITIFTLVFGLVVFTVFSYGKILKICINGSKQMRQKALSTCTPHLASLINFALGAFFEIVQSRYDMSRVPMVLRIILSVYFLTCQPLVNPLIYGLKLTKIRVICKRVLLGKGLQSDAS